MRRAFVAIALAALVGGCGSTTVEQEKPVVVTGGAGAQPKQRGPASAE